MYSQENIHNIHTLSCRNIIFVYLIPSVPTGSKHKLGIQFTYNYVVHLSRVMMVLWMTRIYEVYFQERYCGSNIFTYIRKFNTESYVNVHRVSMCI